MSLPYCEGVILSLLRDALPGVTVESQQSPNVADETPYVSVSVAPGGIYNLALANPSISFSVWSKPSYKSAVELANQVLEALVAAWRNQTTTDYGYIRYMDMTGDMPSELRLAGQPASLFHLTWSTTFGIRPAS